MYNMMNNQLSLRYIYIYIYPFLSFVNETSTCILLFKAISSLLQLNFLVNKINNYIDHMYMYDEILLAFVFFNAELALVLIVEGNSMLLITNNTEK